MTEELAVYQTGGGLIRNLADAERAAQAMAASGYFQDARQAAQAVVKILAGYEMGFGPFASMNGIHIIQGRPAVGANLMGAAVKARARYDYRVREMSNERCAIEFFQGAESLGISEFTIQDAKKAGTKNLERFPRNMLFARAMSNGVRWYCPDVFAGSAVYTPEELGAEVDAEGEVIEATVTVYNTPVEPESVPHWIEDENVRARFWAWTTSQGLSNADVHTALGVHSVKEYTGSMYEARAVIEDYANERASLDVDIENVEEIEF